MGGFHAQKPRNDGSKRISWSETRRAPSARQFIRKSSRSIELSESRLAKVTELKNSQHLGETSWLAKHEEKFNDHRAVGMADWHSQEAKPAMTISKTPSPLFLSSHQGLTQQ